MSLYHLLKYLLLNFFVIAIFFMCIVERKPSNIKLPAPVHRHTLDVINLALLLHRANANVEG